MSTRIDPYKNFRFLVEIDGLTQAGFAECTGLNSTIEVIEYREGGDNHVRKLPGLRKVGDLTLKRGVTDSTELQDWFQNIANGVTDRRNGSIILLDDSLQPRVRWNFRNAFPRKWEGPNLNGHGNDVAIETLVLAFETLERVS